MKYWIVSFIMLMVDLVCIPLAAMGWIEDFALLAQWIKRRSTEPKITGSIPVQGTKKSTKNY